jgi:hypothetical protein
LSSAIKGEEGETKGVKKEKRKKRMNIYKIRGYEG